MGKQCHKKRNYFLGLKITHFLNVQNIFLWLDNLFSKMSSVFFSVAWFWNVNNLKMTGFATTEKLNDLIFYDLEGFLMWVTNPWNLRKKLFWLTSTTCWDGMEWPGDGISFKSIVQFSQSFVLLIRNYCTQLFNFMNFFASLTIWWLGVENGVGNYLKTLWSQN